MKQFMLCLAILMSAAEAAAYQSPGPEEFIRQSTVIFKGRVEKPGASNVKFLPPSNRSAIVRVEDVLLAAKSMGTLTGEEVTVELREANSVKAGEQVTFFTTGWLYGEHLGLKEVGHSSADVSSDSLRQQIADVRNRADEDKLRAEIQHASLVIAGKVLATRHLEERRSASEHDPDWWIAEVEVQTYLKGQPNAAAAGHVSFLFANSRDVMWVRSPKLAEGQQGIWLVGEYKPGGFFPEKAASRLVVLSPLDSHPISELERFKRLVAAAAQPKK
jgi:hypothetical protein